MKVTGSSPPCGLNILQMLSNICRPFELQRASRAENKFLFSYEEKVCYRIPVRPGLLALPGGQHGTPFQGKALRP